MIWGLDMRFWAENGKEKYQQEQGQWNQSLRPLGQA
jgi:uncharacterized protein YukE